MEVQSKVTVRIEPDGAAEKDVVVTGYHGHELVQAETVKLVTETADSTQKIDHGVKPISMQPPEYRNIGWSIWNDARSTSCARRMGDRYGERSEVPLGECVAAMTFEGLTVETGEI